MQHQPLVNVRGLEAVFAAMRSAGIRYAQFKSTSALADSFAGKTDFDLLVHPQDAEPLLALLVEHGFKQRHATMDSVYPAMEDYLWYDPETQAMHHFQLHYRLIFGKAGEKNHWFSDTAKILAHCEPHPVFGIPVVSKGFELMLLSLRLLLKFECDTPRKQKQYNLPKGMRLELRELLQETSTQDWQTAVRQFIPQSPDAVIRLIESFLASIQDGKTVPYADMQRLQEDALSALKPLQRASQFNARAMHKARQSVKPMKTRWLSAGGKTIALVGSDGSGKSTLSQDLTQWLNYKLSAHHFYLGELKNHPPLPKGKLAKWWHGVRQVESRLIRNANYRLATVQEGQWLAGQGYLVVYDRYPLKEFWSMPKPMDGPRSQAEDSDYALERSIYQQIPDYPDILILLVTDLETVLTRRPENRAEKVLPTIQAKVEAVQQIAANPPAGVTCLIIDANQDFETVRQQIKQQLWTLL